MTSPAGKWGLSKTRRHERERVRHVLRTKTRGLCGAVIVEKTSDTDLPACGLCAYIQKAMDRRSPRKASQTPG